jgi:capsular polysaccharide biosynthesis protein
VNLKTIRAQLGRGARRAARALGFQPCGPVSTFHGKPEGAETIDPERVKEAIPSRPILPHRHPLLEANPISYRSTWVQRCEGVKVYGPTVAVADSENNLLADVTVEWGRRSEENWTFRRLCLPPAEVLKGKTLVLASTGGDTYFHWMTDVLPRLRLIREAGFDPAAFDHILVNGTDKPFQKETLESLGVPLHLCRAISRTETAFLCEEAVVSSLPGNSGVVPPETISFLRERLAPSESPSGKKLLIGRRGASHRGLTREKEIREVLERRGFEAVECSMLAVRQQAGLFASAAVVVAAHGAAATNLAFCRPGTRVLELFGPEYVNPCYRDLCVAAELRHAAVIGNGRDWQVYLKHDRPSAPITADLGLVEQVLDEWGC